MTYAGYEYEIFYVKTVGDKSADRRVHFVSPIFLMSNNVFRTSGDVPLVTNIKMMNTPKDQIKLFL